MQFAQKQTNMHMLTLVWIKGQRINLVWALFLVGNLDFDKTWKVDLEIIFIFFFPFLFSCLRNCMMLILKIQ